MPPTLSCTATFYAGGRCTTEEGLAKADHPRPFLVALSRPFSGISFKQAIVLPLCPALFDFCSMPPTLSCTATFCAGGRCTTEEDPPKRTIQDLSLSSVDII
jgi:hypothetical protein